MYAIICNFAIYFYIKLVNLRHHHHFTLYIIFDLIYIILHKIRKVIL